MPKTRFSALDIAAAVRDMRANTSTSTSTDGSGSGLNDTGGKGGFDKVRGSGSGSVEGMRVANIYDLDSRTYVLKLSRPECPKQFLLFEVSYSSRSIRHSQSACQSVNKMASKAVSQSVCLPARVDACMRLDA